MQNKNSTHLNLLERHASIFWREINPKTKSCNKLKELLEIHATYEHWEQVINLSSRAVLHLNKNFERSEFYYIWICALNETQDLSSLKHLAKHLLLMGNQYPIFNCIAAIGYVFSGQIKNALKIIKNQKKINNINNKYYKEALALFLSQLKNKTNVKKGIFLHKKLCLHNNSSYFTWRNFLRVLSQHNFEKIMSRMYNLMHIKFPFSHEPYITSALIAISENNWMESIRLLSQIIKDNPGNKEAILALAHSYISNNQLENSYELISRNKAIFHDEDYDYNFLMANLYRNFAKNKNDKQDCEESILYYEKAISLAKFFHFPYEKLEEFRNEMLLFKSDLNSKKKLLWSIESFLEKKDQLSISSIFSLHGIGQNFKLNLK